MEKSVLADERQSLSAKLEAALSERDAAIDARRAESAARGEAEANAVAEAEQKRSALAREAEEQMASMQVRFGAWPLCATCLIMLLVSTYSLLNLSS